MRFEGRDFGPAGTEISAMAESSEGRTFAFSGCQVIDHQTATCRSSEGVGTGYWPIVTVAGQRSETREEYVAARESELLELQSGSTSIGAARPESSTLLLSFRAPVLTSLDSAQSNPDGTPTTVLNSLSGRGGDQIFVSGANFGPGGSSAPLVAILRGSIGSDQVWDSMRSSPDFLAGTDGTATLQLQRRREALQAIGGEQEVLMMADCVVTAPHLGAVCTTPRGIGTGFAWRLLVGGQTSSELTTPRTSYEEPRITQIFGAGATASPTSGGARIVANGTGFGPLTLEVAELYVESADTGAMAVRTRTLRSAASDLEAESVGLALNSLPGADVVEMENS